VGAAMMLTIIRKAFASGCLPLQRPAFYAAHFSIATPERAASPRVMAHESAASRARRT
jgi:hypothetical protein